MPRAKNPVTPERSMDEKIILEVRLAFADPTMFFNWSEGLEKAQKLGRIKRAKMSPLVYCLTKYLQYRLYESVLNPTGEDYDTCRIEVDDIEFTIDWRQGKDFGQTIIEIPNWLFDFLDNEANMQYMEPTDETPIMDLLQTLYEDALSRWYVPSK